MHIEEKNRIVLKVGSSLVAPDGKGCSSRYLLAIANFILQCRGRGTEVILVSSGSVAAGRSLFKEDASTYGNVTLKKAMAAAGQTEMIAAWNRFFDFPTAQLLLTQHDLQQHERFLSIRESIENLIRSNILPIINENDAVTTDVSRVGDNDNLSALVATAVGADLLIICTDVNGLYDKNPDKHNDAKLIESVREITPKLMSAAGGAGSSVGTGGMRTKLEAARKATQRGVPVILMNGLTETGFKTLLEGGNPGTCFYPSDTPLDKKKHWLMYGSKPKGELIVNNAAIPENGQMNMDVNLRDIVDVNGDFTAGDTVLVKSQSGQKIAKGKAQSGSCLLEFMVKNEQNGKVQVSSTSYQSKILSRQEISLLEE